MGCLWVWVCQVIIVYGIWGGKGYLGFVMCIGLPTTYDDDVGYIYGIRPIR